jgi:methionyl-tRNA synthetase
LRQIAILVQPVVPASAAKLLDQLGVPADARDFADLGPEGRLEPGTKLPPPQPVFPRYVEAEPPEAGATAV